MSDSPNRRQRKAKKKPAVPIEGHRYPCPLQPCHHAYEHADIRRVILHVAHAHHKRPVASNEEWKAGLPASQDWIDVTDPEEQERWKRRFNNKPLPGDRSGSHSPAPGARKTSAKGQ